MGVAMHEGTADPDAPGHVFQTDRPIENVREAAKGLENLAGALLALVGSLHGSLLVFNHRPLTVSGSIPESTVKNVRDNKGEMYEKYFAAYVELRQLAPGGE
jgi:hypothetical protein